MSGTLDRRGVAAAAAAFVIWGLFPLYWYLLRSVPSMQIIAHRIVWSAVIVVGLLLVTRGLRWWHAVRAIPRALPLLAVSSVLIAFNWGLYIWAVTHGYVVEASLGYFINPLVSVLLGVVVLGERLRRLQWGGVALAALGVAWLTWHAGAPPLIALGLAVSFALYGLVRKLVAVEAMSGLAVESLYLLVPAVAYLWHCELQGDGGFLGGWGWRIDLLLVLGGAMTAVPLVWFAYGVRRVPLTLIGLLQYIAPTLQLLAGVLVMGEPFDHARLLGFGLIWAGLAVFMGQGLLRCRQGPVGIAGSTAPVRER
ncbi:EamA family transporter RarD [Pseudoxanthomonas composti]|uniref:EamA family transporter RarD n=1 Tax=Pseudoxanthomonas composti TaxID=2137479 RepID=A0A4Q1JTS4_9GAMM|nr:EamA family transporter RarD [Pseudoxanthomonas composti]RXR03500.1 EamA family transporter RarD [Pseudoxanthomonas composti]